MHLYPPPQELQTEVFTRLPDAFRVTGRASDWGAANRPGQPVDSFLEGPSFDRDGNLWVVDIPWGRVFRIDPAGAWTLVAEYDGWPNGLKIHRDGRIFITDYSRGIIQLDPADGSVSPLLIHRQSESFRGVNDLHFDRQGRLYFTDQGQTGMHDPSGRVYRYDPESGRLDLLLGNGPSPNGLVLSPDETVLYVGMTRGNAVWRLPLFADGGIYKASIFAQLAGGIAGADGLAVDREGRVLVCDAGNGCVWVFTRFGEPVWRIRACSDGRATTNLAFGGPDNRSLFITESETGTILRAEMDVPGQPMYAQI